MHIGHITEALYCRIIRIAILAVLLNVNMQHESGPEHLMSIVEKKTSIYSISVKSAYVRQYRACVM